MRSPFAGLSIAAVAVCVFMGFAHAGVPSSINYQGILLDEDGQPAVGIFSTTFSIYSVSEGGAPLWSETIFVETDSAGRFSVALGETQPLTYEELGGPFARWLGVRLNVFPAQDEMTPRQKLHAVPYSLRVQSIDGAVGGEVSGDLSLSGEIEALGPQSKVRFLYDLLVDLPSPAAFHGAVAHVHETGRLYYAHAAQWIPLANESDITAISVLSAPDGDPDSAVVVDNDGNVVFRGYLTGDDGPLTVGDSGMVVNGQVVINVGPVNINVVININNGANVNGGDLRIIGPAAALLIQNGARLRIQNGCELEVESGARFVTRSGGECELEAGAIWRSYAPLITEAELDITVPGFLRINDDVSSDKMTLELNEIHMLEGPRTLELRPTDLTVTGGQFDINADKLVVSSPVPVEILSLTLTGGPGLAVSGGGGVAVTGGGAISTDPLSLLQINGPSTFTQPINAPLQVGVGAPGAGALHVIGNITATGAKLFVQDHPTDPTKEIHYIALEAGEAGTYTRGTARLTDGVAVIDLPEHFALVTSADGLTAQITPRGPVQSMLYVEMVSASLLIVKASHEVDNDVPFDYMVNGIRIGYQGHQPIRTRPSVAGR